MPLPTVWQISNYGWNFDKSIESQKNGTHLVMLKDIKDILKTQQRVLQKSNIFMDDLFISTD